MKKKFSAVIIIPSLCILLLFVITSAVSINTSHMHAVSGKEISYTINGKNFRGYIAWDEAKKGKRPGILVVHEWWGSNEYVRMRARRLAELGYIALAVDMFGEGRQAKNPQEAQQLSGEIYGNMELLKSRMEAAEEKLKSYSQTDSSNIGAMGYCFGGSVALNSAKLGMDFKGVVSFHGGLAGAPADKSLLKADVLVCHGGDDKFVSDEEVNAFKKSMDSIGARYSFEVYPGATHAFTNPQATELGKKFNIPIAYNEAADKKSWNDMKLFFAQIFKE